MVFEIQMTMVNDGFKNPMQHKVRKFNSRQIKTEKLQLRLVIVTTKNMVVFVENIGFFNDFEETIEHFNGFEETIENFNDFW